MQSQVPLRSNKKNLLKEWEATETVKKKKFQREIINREAHLTDSPSRTGKWVEAAITETTLTCPRACNSKREMRHSQRPQTAKRVKSLPSLLTMEKFKNIRRN
jgi:hypothetical protein